jgi:peptide/nickel transport system permease protein
MRDAAASAPPPAVLGARGRPGMVRAWLGNRLAVTGGVLVAALIIVAIFAPLIATQNPGAIHPSIRLEAPSAAHWFGTDDLGQDVYSRVVYGSRVSLEIGGLVVVLTSAAGVLAGLLAGYVRVWDNVIMRIMDALLAIPPVLLAIALLAVLGARVSNVVISLAIAYTPQLARLLRAQVLVLREMTYTEAARSIGSSQWRVMLYHLLPNMVSPLLVQSTITFANTVLTEAALSYLGVGEPPYIPSWGNEMSTGHAYLVQAPWIILFPGLAIVVCVLGLNLLGDGLRDILDPRLRGTYAGF